MKVLLITVRSDFGGGPRHVDQLVNALPPDVELYMAFPQDGDPYAIKWIADNRIKDTIYIPYRKFDLSSLMKLRTFVKRHNIDIVHSHGNGAGLYSRLLKVICPNIKVVHTFHGISDTYASKLKMIAHACIGRLLEPFADVYIAVSEGEKKMAICRKFSMEGNTKVIYNGIEKPSLTRSTEQYEHLRFATLTRFDYPKNMSMLFDIAYDLKSEDVEFVWIGDGEEKMDLEERAKREGLNITFTGFSTEPMRYLRESDWYISTSRFEGLPYALIEAASVGLPIVATNVKGNNECVRDGFNGFLFDTKEEAIGRIREILKGKYDYNTLSSNSVKFFDEYFTIDKMIRDLVVLYSEL